MDTSSTVGGLAAFSLLGVGGLLALPVFALPVVLVGAPVSRGLVNAAILGAVGFVVFAGFGAVLLACDTPLRWAGRAAQRLGNLVLRKRPALAGPIAYGLFRIRYKSRRSSPEPTVAGT